MFWINTYRKEDLPDPSKPLEQPKPEVIGDFYVRLGMAVSAWQFVEHSLISIFARVVGAKNYKALAASFHTPTSFRARLDMTSAALSQLNLGEEYVSEWKEIYELACRKSKRRNEIAHSLVMFDPLRKDSQQLFLTLNINNPAKNPDIHSQKGFISMKELEELLHSFELLHEKILKFDQRLADTGLLYNVGT